MQMRLIILPPLRGFTRVGGEVPGVETPGYFLAVPAGLLNQISVIAQNHLPVPAGLLNGISTPARS
jgi:hypothetical protein